MKRFLVFSVILSIILCCSIKNVFSQADAGPDKVMCKDDAGGVIIGGNGDPSWCYTWSPTTGLNDPHILHPTAQPSITTTYTLKVVGPNFSFTSTSDMKVSVAEVTINPVSMNTIESLNSGNYAVTVTPNTITPTSYKWIWEAPSGAGNSPNVNFSNETSQTTNVTSTRWFASPDDRHWNVTGTSCTYSINCEVKIDTKTCKASTHSRLIVTVDATGQTSWPTFSGANTIIVSTRVAGGNTEWYVSGIGGFTRTAPVATLNLPATSQFYNKVNVHESKHVTQWTSEVPWVNLFHANNLYNLTLKNLTSAISEADLRNKIAIAVQNKQNSDAQIAVNTKCAREIAAFTVDRGVVPHYLELDDAEVPAAYSCTP